MVICLERGADLRMAQLMPLPLTVSCFSKIQISFAFLVLAHLRSPGKRAVKRVCVCYSQKPLRVRLITQVSHAEVGCVLFQLPSGETDASHLLTLAVNECHLM